ncbi:olfactory receptor 8H3-like [Tachyglossus aculeatus]|uniref:olfactory receptor 8H3-like n=1 Tax=Tachyglossus aculeatus TaxID=9261 RepID=UPI0018F6D6B4|nr:olfactory receptor 8H3-like [Tachyglossus aculeatus]
MIYKIKKAFAWTMKTMYRAYFERKESSSVMQTMRNSTAKWLELRNYKLIELYNKEHSHDSLRLKPAATPGTYLFHPIDHIFSKLINEYFPPEFQYSFLSRGEMLKPLTAGKVTGMTYFILMGLRDSPRAQLVLFMVFLSYLYDFCDGEEGLILIIQKDSQVHRHMYFFLCGLSFVDPSYSTAITPKTLENALTSRKKISFIGCFAQKVCMWLTVGSHGVAFTSSLIGLLFIGRLLFRNSKVIQHFFCDTSPIWVLPCTGTYNTEMMIFISAGSTLEKSLIMITVSYMAIISAILKTNSTVRRKKAFSTCASHLTGVTIFYGTLNLYIPKPSKSYSLGQDLVASVF